MRRHLDHPLAGKTGLVPEYRARLYDAIGDGAHPCHWCGKTVRWMPGKRTVKGALVVDHLNDDPLDDSLENLVPSCQRCNTWRSQKHRLVRDDERFYVNSLGNRVRIYTKTCPTCGKEYDSHRGRYADGTSYCSHPCASR